MTIQVHAECLRLDGAGQKTSDRRIAMTFLVAQIFLLPLYYYVYIYPKTHSTYTHDDMTIYRPRLVLAPVSSRRSDDDPQLYPQLIAQNGAKHNKTLYDPQKT
jgi:hypothetical protein